ncbi:MAG: hypothetical protein ACI9IV_002310, partial [Paracoccaceae bacterium]
LSTHLRYFRVKAANQTILPGAPRMPGKIYKIDISQSPERHQMEDFMNIRKMSGISAIALVLADWMGRTGALIAPVVDHMAMILNQGCTRLYVDETTAPVLDPGRGEQDRLPLGRTARRSRLERPRAAGGGVPLPTRPKG